MSDKKKRKSLGRYEKIDAAHNWFGLTYCSYMVLPRTMLQSMPDSWQDKFIKLINEMDDRLGHYNKVYSYTVLSKNSDNKFMHDDLRDYERGRRLLI
jgi:hypothetical protein